MRGEGGYRGFCVGFVGFSFESWKGLWSSIGGFYFFCLFFVVLKWFSKEIIVLDFVFGFLIS